MAMAVGAPFVPGPIIGCCLLPLLVAGFQPLHRDVKISYGAKLAVQPLQFNLYLSPLGVVDHRREKHNGCAQSSERNAHSMQAYRVASACRLMTCSQFSEVAARYHSKCCVGRQFGVQPRRRVAALLLRRLGTRAGFTCWFWGWRHGCLALSGP